jgi:hypothetical protein
MIKFNGFTMDGDYWDKEIPQAEMVLGIYLVASFLNHSCIPNTNRYFLNGEFI